jgi:hypothetical protein
MNLFNDKYESSKYDFCWLIPNLPDEITDIGYTYYRDGRIFGKRGRFIGALTSSEKKKKSPHFCTAVSLGPNLRVCSSCHSFTARHFLVNPRPDLFNGVDHTDRITIGKGNKFSANRASNLRYCNQIINALNVRIESLKPRKDGRKRPYFAKVDIGKTAVIAKYFPTERIAKYVSNQLRAEIVKDLYYHLCSPFTGEPSMYYKLYLNYLEREDLSRKLKATFMVEGRMCRHC